MLPCQYLFLPFSDMPLTAVVTLDAVAKRVREQKFKEFGDLLRQWRGKREVETVVRLVRTHGVEFDGATLRGWEYGWIGRPDPIRLLALARVYGRSAADVMAALSVARGISTSATRDLPRHARTGKHAPHQGGADVPASVEARVRELESALESTAQERDFYRGIITRADELARPLALLLRAESLKIARARTARR